MTAQQGGTVLFFSDECIPRSGSDTFSDSGWNALGRDIKTSEPEKGRKPVFGLRSEG